MDTHQLDRKVWRSPLYFVAFGFGSGTLPKMPGTYGTLIAIPVYLLMMNLPLIGYIALLLLFTVLGIWMCGVVTQEIGIPDYPGAVWDEVVGYLLTMLAAPIGWIWILVGFILFRIFDIWKPWPIGWVDDKVGGGVGVILDDLIAAVFSWIVLHIIIYFFY